MNQEERIVYRMIQNREAYRKALLLQVVQGPAIGETMYLEDAVVQYKTPASEFWDTYEQQLLDINTTGLYELGSSKVYAMEIGTKPRLIICGGGHVATELVRLAANLDFTIYVLEEREEFADRLQQIGADYVVMKGFAEGLSSIPASLDNYYVCMTRGHHYDVECLQQILPGAYAYLGMMGSSKRSAVVKEQLKKAGFDANKVDAIHAPIGLSIGAKTPAEIAVSVMAELIAVKNGMGRKHLIEDEILAYLAADNERIGNKDCVLCTIYQKCGSAPREAGTQMLVGENGLLCGTIGGGLVEATVITRCQELLRAKTVQSESLALFVDTAEVIDGGMLCGGSVEVLLKPFIS